MGIAEPVERAAGQEKRDGKPRRSDHAKDEQQARADEADNEHGLADAGGRIAGGDAGVGDGSGNKRSKRAQEKGEAADARHGVHRKIALANEIGRQPGKKEVDEIVSRKVAERGAPPGTLAENFDEVGELKLAFASLEGVRARAPAHPGDEPEHADESEDDEKRAPAELGHKDSTEQGAEGGAGTLSRGDGAIAEATVGFCEIAGKDFCVGGIRDSFADAEDEAGDKQGGESVQQTRNGGGGGPDEEADGENPAYVEAIHEKADGDLKGGVGDEKRREQIAELLCRKAELGLDQRCGDREIAAVHIVDEDGKGKKDERKTQGRGEARVFGAGIHRKSARQDRGRVGADGTTAGTK